MSSRCDFRYVLSVERRREPRNVVGFVGYFDVDVTGCLLLLPLMILLMRQR